MTYNVHGCVGLDGRRSYSRIATVIGSLRPDVVALQELDVGRFRSGGVHQARVLAELLEMHFHFHPALRVKDEEYGNAILSRFPMRLVRVETLPEVRSRIFHEPRGFLWVELETPEGACQFLTTHLGLGRSERLLQARALVEYIAGTPGPVIFGGDLNSRLQSGVHRIFRQFFNDALRSVPLLRRPTFSAQLPFICLDYIYVTRDVAVMDARVLRSAEAKVASDHLPVMADLRLGAEATPEDGGRRPATQ